MSEQVDADAEPCDVLRGSDGPVYFLLGGRLYVVHEILGRWIEADVEPNRRRRPAAAGAQEQRRVESAGPVRGEAAPQAAEAAQEEVARERSAPAEPTCVEHWLVTASIGRFGTPAVFRLQRRPAPPSNGPDRWTVRAERR